MGFLPPTGNLKANSNLVHSTTWSLPTAIVNGDTVYLCLYEAVSGGAGVSFDTPSGFTLVGSQTLGVAGWTGVTVAIFKKTWQTGDATSGNITHSGGSANSCEYCSWIVRSDTGTHTLHTDTTTTGSGSGNGTVPALSPAVQSDLRVVLLFEKIYVSPGVPSTPAATDENPVPQKLTNVVDFGFNGIANEAAQLWYSLWRDDAMDGGTGTVALGGTITTYIIRVLDFTDGSNHNGGGSADEEAPFMCTADPTAYTPEQAGQDQDSANANWWGGGTNTLGDHD